MTDERKHSHYFRPFPYDSIDIYRFLEVFDVTCPVAQHIIKKAVATGKRGHKDLQRDWQDILDSAQRKLDMLDEDCQVDTDNVLPDDSGWFDTDEQELGENAVADVKQESPWYPKLKGWKWYEISPGVTPNIPSRQTVHALTRYERGVKEYNDAPDFVSNWNWDSGSQIVAYAVKKD